MFQQKESNREDLRDPIPFGHHPSPHVEGQLLLMRRNLSCRTRSSAISNPPSHGSSDVSPVVSSSKSAGFIEDKELISIAAVFEFLLSNRRRLLGGSQQTSSSFSIETGNADNRRCLASLTNFAVNSFKEPWRVDKTAASEWSVGAHADFGESIGKAFLGTASPVNAGSC